MFSGAPGHEVLAWGRKVRFWVKIELKQRRQALVLGLYQVTRQIFTD